MTNTEAEVEGGNRRVPESSIMGSLASRRKEIADKQTTVMPVPRWDDPKIFVRYKLIPHDDIRKALDKIEAAKPRDKGSVEVLSNCDVLIQACVEVWGELDDDKPYSLNPDDPHGPRTKFDKDLARNLGLNDQATARQVVRALFFSDADILTTAGSFMDFVGYKRDMIEEVIEGESEATRD
jgi:hypothetical protein